MIHFINRTGIYIPIIDKENIISFLSGYEIGTNGECAFIHNLSEYIEKEYKIERTSIGWPGQVQQYSTENNLEWVTSFKKIASEYLAKSDI
ncbi:MAG: hypothetical protein ABIO79_06695 [Ferruginibacter sp.]